MLRLLGPIELVAGSRSLDVGGPRQRTVLAMLALSVGRVTSIDGLIAAVWGDDPPETARGQIQVCISGLRKVLAEAGHREAIKTVPPGYRLELGAGEIDTARFTQLADSAREAADDGRVAEAVTGLRDALALWRGPALAGLDSEVVRRGATALDERRLTAIEERIRLDLRLGEHQQLVSELHALVSEHPLRERLYELLMMALYRSGRPAEALTTYRHAREVLIEEIGVEPGQELRGLELAILNRDPALDLDSLPEPGPSHELLATTVPKQMPASVADFTGRAAEVADIVGILTEQAAGYAVPVVAISGRGGVGKSSLAVRVAHEVAAHFPDGQLYADMRDGDGDPTSQLARFLRALGIAGRAVPESLDERAALYRSTLAGRRVLVVLDDVPAEEQALPLLPGSPGCAVIVTSLVRLGNLPGAYHADLDPLDTATALALLNRIVGDRRVLAEEADAAELVSLCEGLPLALRIGGARLASRPHWRIGALVHRLRDEGRRLDELSHRSWTLRSSIALTCENLTEQARRLFRLLALVDTPELNAWTAAALLDTALADAEDVLEHLVDARLLDTVEYPEARRVRYRLHDLVRVYAKELPTTPAEGAAALARVFGGWLTLVDAAHRAEYGGDYTVIHSAAPRWRPPDADPGEHVGAEGALVWWDSERAALVAAVRQAARTGFVAQCWDLALTCVTLFEVKGYFDDWKAVTQLAHDVSRQAGDHNGVGAMRYSMGTWCMFQSRLAEAEQCFADAVDAFALAGNEHGGALALRNAAHVDGLSGRHEAMMTKYDIALATMRAVGDRIGEAHILRNQARYRLDGGDLDRARVLLGDALTICREEGCRRAEAQAVHTLAELHLTAGEFDRAREALHSVLRIVRDASDRIGETHALYALGVLRQREGRPDHATTTLAHALDLARRVHERVVEARAHHALGEISLGRGDHAVAAEHLEAARVLFVELKSAPWQERTLGLLAEARRRAAEAPAGPGPRPGEVHTRDHRAA